MLTTDICSQDALRAPPMELAVAFVPSELEQHSEVDGSQCLPDESSRQQDDFLNYPVTMLPR